MDFYEISNKLRELAIGSNQIPYKKTALEDQSSKAAIFYRSPYFKT